MKTMLSRLAALKLVFLALFVFSLGGCQNYDKLVQLDQEAQKRWSNIDVDLQSRADLVPQLVAVVKGAAKHEQDTLDKVMQARASATSIHLTADDLTDPAKMAAFQKAQDELKGSLSRLMVTQEAYPEVRAIAAFHDLQVQIEGIENRLRRSRQQYNDAAGAFNTELAQIHGQVTNGLTGKPFKARPYFEASAESKVAPAISF